MDDVRIPPAGDPFAAKQVQPTEQKRLARLEASYRHELLSIEEREILRDRIVLLRRRVGC